MGKPKKKHLLRRHRNGKALLRTIQSASHEKRKEEKWKRRPKIDKSILLLFRENRCSDVASSFLLFRNGGENGVMAICTVFLPTATAGCPHTTPTAPHCPSKPTPESKEGGTTVTRQEERKIAELVARDEEEEWGGEENGFRGGKKGECGSNG